MANVNRFLERALLTLESRKTSDNPILYDRFSKEKSSGAPDIYGTGDAAVILYTLGLLPDSSGEKERWAASLQKFQNPETGMFAGEGHTPIHSAAFAVSTLELFDAKPLYPLKELERFVDERELISFLEGLDWLNSPWGESLNGAGLYAALVLSDSVADLWEKVYFDWLEQNADPETGLWRKGCVLTADGEAAGAPLFHHLAGTFHYLFNLAYRKMPIQYPERLLDTCLSLHGSGKLGLPENELSFMHLDWTYTVLCGMRQTDHRREECLAMISATSEELVQMLARLGEESKEPFPDLHGLCGAVCTLAAIQQLLPELVETEQPLRLVLDRRPFI